MAQLDTAILAALQALVGEDRVLTDSQSLEQYGRDWTRFHQPAPSAVVLPGSTEEVQAIVRLAAEHKLALVPSGGRTGLSAGAVATQPLGQRVDDDVRPVLDRPLQVRRRKRAVDHQGQIVGMSDIGDSLEIENVDARVAEGLAIDRPGVGLNGSGEVLRLVGVNEGRLDTHLAKRDVEQ